MLVKPYIHSVASFDSHFSLVFKILDIRLVFMDENSPDKHSLTVYASLTLVTTLWCTSLIIYRILSVGWVNGGPWGGLRAYRHVIEVLVESSAFYCVCLIFYAALYASNSWGQDYIDAITGIARVWKLYSFYNIFICD